MLRRFAGFLGTNPVTRWAVAWALPKADRLLLKTTAGRIHVAPFPTLFLTTRGRKTGKRIVTPLFFVAEGDRLAVAATNFGRPRHPDWSANLLADPWAEVRNGSDRGTYRARLAEGSERARYWERLVEVYPSYATYEEQAQRAVRLFVLEPDSRAER
jgi:deazaflavin-dependent oxidoreductase (nitroreductase family)